jgi:hypothetical protein
MLKRQTGTDPIPQDRSDDGEKEGKKRRLRLGLGIAALAATVGVTLGAAGNFLMGKDDAHAQEVTTSETSTPFESSETSTPSTEPEAPEASPPASELDKPSVPEKFTAPESLTGSTVLFEMANGELVTGTENLVSKLEVPYTAGMTNKEYDTELVKRLGILVNINTSNAAMNAYKDTEVGAFGEGVKGVMNAYGENGAVAEAFGEGRAGVSGQLGITDYISSVSDYTRQRAGETGKDHQCIYLVSSPLEDTPLATGEINTELLTERCGEVQEDGSLIVERERELRMTFTPQIADTVTLMDSSSMEVVRG